MVLPEITSERVIMLEAEQAEAEVVGVWDVDPAV